MSDPSLLFSDEKLSLNAVADFAFRRERAPRRIEFHRDCLQRARASRARLESFVERELPIYGVTTGFGDSCFRVIPKDKAEILQRNLVSYLLTGSGPLLSEASTRALFVIRLKSLSRGYSGVSEALLERMALYLEKDWLPAIPREGSLGASGDLIPLAYLAEVLQGEGELLVPGKPGETRATRAVLEEAGIAPYVLKSKEGLSLVNGTSVMAGIALENLNSARFLVETTLLSTAWLCIALRGRTEAFEPLVNEIANTHDGQRKAAAAILSFLREEKHTAKPLSQIAIENAMTTEFVQDRYSLRCAPQVLGPVLETIDRAQRWLETELNGVSDNPLIGEDGSLAMGGNFYGGYLSQGMDYLKISLAHVADLLDRQLMTLIDEKSNRGLPANLANWPGIPEEERFLHHGLKGLHQSVNAITSEIMAKAMPNGIFSRSSESHNQDKVSLGLSAAVQCEEMLKQLYQIQSLTLVCLAQALDLRKVELRGPTARAFYAVVREHVPYVECDTKLGPAIDGLTAKLKTLACQSRSLERIGDDE